MQDIQQETLNECTKAEQSALVVLWEVDQTEVGGERYFFRTLAERKRWSQSPGRGDNIRRTLFREAALSMNGKGASARPTLKVSNLHGMVTGMAEDLQSLVGGTVVRRKVYARFLDAVNFVNGNSDADPEQEVISRWRIQQCSELSAVSASFVLSTPTETDGAVFPGRIMLANTCTWTYRGDECGYHGPAVADEYDQPTSDITKDKCSKCLSGCKFLLITSATLAASFPLTNFRSNPMTQTESAILAHARRCAPAESVWLRGENAGGERYFPCANISGEPEAYFRTSLEDWLRAEMQGEIVALGRQPPRWSALAE